MNPHCRLKLYVVHTIVEHPNQQGDTITVQEPLD